MNHFTFERDYISPKILIAKVISADQPGFMIERHSFYNTLKLTNILSIPNSDVSDVVLALDVEKAFNREECRF